MANSVESNIITDVAVVKTEVEQLKAVIVRMDETIAKMSEIATETSKILAVHSNKLNNQGAVIDAMKENISSYERDTTEKTADLRRKIDDMVEFNHKEREKYHKELMAALARMEQKMDVETEKLSDRVSSLEKWRWWIMGVAAAGGFILAKLPAIQSLF